MAAVFVGGSLGAITRYYVGIASGALLPRFADVRVAFPLATLLVNLTGAFGLGVAMVLLAEVARPSRVLRSFVGIGFFGSYTTYSTMSLEALELFGERRLSAAATYLGLSVGMGLLACLCGLRVGSAVASKGLGRASGR